MLTKYSLQKQLVIIFSIIAIGVLAILLPIIDNNLTHVIDNEMYDVLTRSQNDFYSYDFSPDYAGSDKQIYHFTYNINEDTLTTAPDTLPHEGRGLPAHPRPHSWHSSYWIV